MKSTPRRLHWLILPLTILISFFAATVVAQDQRDDVPKIIRKSGGVLQGSATKRVQPVYPPLAKEISGAVVVEVTIDEEGNVIAARAISGHPLLKDAAVEAAKGWTFSPTQLQGVPVKVIGTITFNFHLGREEVEALKEKINANPNSAELHYKLAELYHDDSQHDLAIAEYQHVLNLEPDSVEAYLGLGESYFATGRLEEAIETYKRGLTLEALPGFKEMLNIDLGQAYLKQRRLQEALEAFKQAVAISPDSVDGQYNLGLTFVKLGDKESAIKVYEILKDLSQDRAGQLWAEIRASHKMTGR